MANYNEKQESPLKNLVYSWINYHAQKVQMKNNKVPPLPLINVNIILIHLTRVS